MSNLLILFYSYFELVKYFILLINILIYFSPGFCRILCFSNNIIYYLFFKVYTILIVYNLISLCRTLSIVSLYKNISYFIFVTIKFTDLEISIQQETTTLTYEKHLVLFVLHDMFLQLKQRKLTPPFHYQMNP